MLNRNAYQNKKEGASSQKTSEKSRVQQFQNPRAFNETTGFSSYLTKAKIDELYEQKKILKGKLSVTPNGYNSGMVTTEFGMIQIPDKLSLNRALDGQEVYINLLNIKTKQNQIFNWQIGSETKEDTVQTLSQVTAHVIYADDFQDVVIECFLDTNQKDAGIKKFIPIDKRYPVVKVAINEVTSVQTNQVYEIQIKSWKPQMDVPGGIIIKEGAIIDLEDLDQVAEYVMKRSGIEYSYHQEPSQQIIDEIHENEQKLINDVKLPLEEVFSVSQTVLENYQEQIAKIKKQKHVFDSQNRKDFTDELVFTIDPDTAKDFDDACHIKLISSDGSRTCFKTLQNLSDDQIAEKCKNAIGYEIGVHIADVTHYVPQNSQIDLNAQKTTTSVYLTDRCCPMIPFQLADGLCSLNPAVPRYTYSVVFDISKNAELLPQTVWFGRSVIFSHARLDYVGAQLILEKTANFDQNSTSFNGFPTCKGVQKAVFLAVEHMDKISKTLRAQREELGALQLRGDAVRFQIHNKVVKISPPEAATDAHHLIEEFMVAANCLVGIRLNLAFPGLAPLRSHPPPLTDKFVQDIVSAYGKIDFSNGKQVVSSISNIAQNINSRLTFDEQIWTSGQQSMYLADACFQANNLARASYIVGLSEQLALFAHWGIHAQMYMHFTSPIRRYADGIAHRMLSVALQTEREGKSDRYGVNSLKIENLTCLYTCEGFLPPIDYLHICDELNPISDAVETKKLGGTRFSGVEDIESGKCVDLGGQKAKNHLKQQIERLLNDEVVDQAVMEDADNDSPARDAFEGFNKILQDSQLGLTFLKMQVEQCNQQSINAKNASLAHYQIMLNMWISQKHHEVITDCFMISQKEKKNSLIFVVPTFGISFSSTCGYKVEGKTVKIKQFNVANAINQQKVEVEEEQIEIFDRVLYKEVEFGFLKPIKIRIQPAEELVAGVDFWLVE